MKKVNYQIQVNTLVSLTPEQRQTFANKLSKAIELALFEIDQLDGIYVSIEQDK